MSVNVPVPTLVSAPNAFRPIRPAKVSLALLVPVVSVVLGSKSICAFAEELFSEPICVDSSSLRTGDAVPESVTSASLAMPAPLPTIRKAVPALLSMRIVFELRIEPYKLRPLPKPDGSPRMVVVPE